MTQFFHTNEISINIFFAYKIDYFCSQAVIYRKSHIYVNHVYIYVYTWKEKEIS